MSRQYEDNSFIKTGYFTESVDISPRYKKRVAVYVITLTKKVALTIAQKATR